ncbi:PIN domain-containing protein [Propylenella binzhouense]|uniref:DUF4935 domain-containing protein n=1 Tax=Propylenella binzhouense TaxID=2555902 RepID=A0A964T2R6_9HYPH|nr:PIN domain-containing protein [Propylenella binzhouense]MYZ47295.1 hypothetical protein [Propylenella binzhouense]
MEQSQSSKYRPAEPLESRHVFLDTQVYRALGYNPENPALKTLKDHIQAHRVVLHVTDITLLEVKRQLVEAAHTRARELIAIERDLRRWRKQAPDATPKRVLEIDAAGIGEELFQRFYSFIAHECRAKVHNSLAVVSAEEVFQSYFARKAPFDREGSKEFPDAFALAGLSKAAASSGDKIYIVTGDGAMGRAAKGDPNLLSLRTIQEVLSRAAAKMGSEAEGIAEALLNEAAFDASFERLLETGVKDVAFIYAGDLAEGEAYEGELTEIEQVGDWSIVGLSEKRVSLILDTTIKVSVEVQYEDRDSAFYDREDGVWIGAEDAAMEVEDKAEVAVLVEIDRASGEVVGGELLTSEIRVSGSYDDLYS